MSVTVVVAVYLVGQCRCLAFFSWLSFLGGFSFTFYISFLPLTMWSLNETTLMLMEGEVCFVISI